MLPLENVRILAVEQFGAGPFGTMHLADLGAELIKIEDPSQGGDVARYVASGLETASKDVQIEGAAIHRVALELGPAAK